MDFSLFEELGLTTNEAKLYLLLLELGSVSSGVLVKKSGFQSSVVYHLLGRLVEKGVVHYVKKGEHKLYSATNPENFTQLLEQKEKKLQAAKVSFAQLLPQLISYTTNRPKQTNVQVYTGKHGLTVAFNDILNTAKEYLVYGGTGNFSKLVPSYQKFFQAERITRKIKQKNLWFGVKLREDNAYETTKYLDPNNNLPFSFIIYNEKVLINLFEEEPNVSILIESKTMAQACKNFFDDLWERTK